MQTDKFWKILLVDDDEDTLILTKNILSDFTYDEKGLIIVLAKSAEEAKDILKNSADIAFIILDVVMETKHAGLDLVTFIRGELKNDKVRIMIRTGFPGEAPELMVMQHLDINDYEEKTELTPQKLKSKIITGLRCYNTIDKLQKTEKELNESFEKIQILFNTMTEGAALNEIIYDEQGEMIDYKVLEVNNAFYSIGDFENKQVIGNTATQLYGTSTETINLFFKELKKQNKPIFSEYKHQDSERVFYVATSPIINDKFVCTFFDITKIKKNEAELTNAKEIAEKNEDKYKQVVTDLNNAQSFAKIGSWKWYIQENRLEWSNEMKRIFGVDENHFSGNLQDIIQQRIHPEDVAMVEASNLSVVEKGIPVPLEYRIILENGTIKTLWAEAGELIKDEYNKPLILAGVVQDITEDKYIEQQLSESEEKYKLAFKTSPDSININKLDGTFVDISNGFTELTGYSKEDVIGKSSFSINIWAKPEDREKLIDGLTKNKKVENLETLFRKKDGSLTTALMSANIINLNGQPHILSITRDISARIKTEKAIRKLNRAIESAQVSIVITDVNGNIEYANPYFTKLTGYTPTEYAGQNPRFLQSKVHPQEFYQNLWGTIKNGDIWEGEFYNRKKNGEYFWETAIISPILNDFHEITNFVAVKVDITENKRITSELIAAKEKAEESDRLKTSFLQNLSHEIRTPMNAIIGFSELLIKYYNNKPKLEQYSDIIIQRSNDLLEIIDEILDIAKIESGQIPIHYETCNLYKLFSELELLFHQQKKHSNNTHIDFIVNKNNLSKDFQIITDSGKLKQIFINLINNSYKFTENGKIEIGCFQDTNNLIFYVSDTGIGIPKEKHAIIFERFMQLNQDKTKVYGGTGLGLSIVKGLINLLNGEIWVESEINKGSIFRFSIPYKAGVPEITKLENNFLPNNLDYPGGTILVVEDDDFNTEYLKEVLSETSLKVICTKLGCEAIQISKEQSIDIILMDIRLPDINGYEASQIIKNDKPQMSIIAQTAYASPIDKEMALKSGCIDYISKPIKRDLLLQKIKTHLMK